VDIGDDDDPAFDAADGDGVGRGSRFAPAGAFFAGVRQETQSRCEAGLRRGVRRESISIAIDMVGM